MSTKIYNGFKFNSGNLHDLQVFLMRWRAMLKPLHRAELASVHARLATAILDQAAINPERHAGKTPWMEAFSSINDRQNETKKTGYRDCEVDFDFEVSIFPHGRKIYGIIYTERGSWRDLFLDQPEIADFSYWNNSNKPEEISAREWHHRRKVWEVVLTTGTDPIPAMRGLSAQCTTEFRHIEVDEIIAAIKPHEDRVAEQAKNIVMGAEMQRRLEELSEKERKSELFSTLFAVEQWLKSDEGDDLLKPKMEELRSILPHSITKEMLLQKIMPSEGATNEQVRTL